jgi:hypothetical protein
MRQEHPTGSPVEPPSATRFDCPGPPAPSAGAILTRYGLFESYPLDPKQPRLLWTQGPCR